MPLKNFLGYSLREPYSGEINYFKNNPTTAGMMTPDERVILNPYRNQYVNDDSVVMNEAIRLALNSYPVRPYFPVTKNQEKYFQATPYYDNPIALRHTIIARYLSGDPSSGEVTPEQKTFADQFINYWQNRGK
jgi:hypothetical protein